MLEKDKANLLTILDSCHKIFRFTADLFDADAFFADQESFDAVLMNFILIGEAVSKLSEPLKTSRRISLGKRSKGLETLLPTNILVWTQKKSGKSLEIICLNLNETLGTW